MKRFMPEPLKPEVVKNWRRPGFPLFSPEALCHLGLPGNRSPQDSEKMVYVLKGEI